MPLRGSAWGTASPGALALAWLLALLFGGAGSAADRAIFAALYLGEASPFAGIVLAVTHLGGWIALTILSFAAASWMLVNRRSRDAALLLTATWMTRAAVEIQKQWIDRARPDDPHLIDVHSPSFPSGHAANTLVTLLMVGVLVFGTRAAVAVALALSLLVGMSRPMLGVHWLSDVIGGWAFGLFCAMVAMYFHMPGHSSEKTSRIRR